MQGIKETLLSLLGKTKDISKDALDKALVLHKQQQIPLRRALIQQGIISEEGLLALLSQQLHVPQLHIDKHKFDPDALNLIPEHMAKQYNVIVLSRMGSTITVAMSDPLNILALDDIKIVSGCDIDMVLCPEEEIIRAIDEQYRSAAGGDVEEIPDDLLAVEPVAEGQEAEVIKDQEIELSSAVRESEKPPIVKLVDLMLTQALKKRASDIHIEPELTCMRVRYRVDGALHEYFKIPKQSQNAVIARLKIISGLDITENRIPQDGRFRVRAETKEIDFRVSSLPTTFGQKFVLRLLDKANLSIGLDKLGFSEVPLKTFKTAVSKPFGMILVTGPTGSGKSTTLYSVLNQLNTPERNIITIEDPVEYQVDGITQVHVKPDIGLDFATGLRSILRQSPDVIMIGEIRDPETADIAIKASLTGQVVLSTLHTNDAISSITRLIDMGVEPFLVASSLIMLCAQRLCRKLCLKCRVPVEVPAEFLSGIGFQNKTTFYAAKGCKYCNNTGFYGRIAILETVLINDVIREMVMKKKPLDEIRRYAIESCGMCTLRDDAFNKVRDGTTTLDEALRVTTEE